MPTIAPRTAFPRSSPVRGGVSGDGGARGPGHPVAKGALFFLSAQILVLTADGTGRVPVNEILLKTQALPNLIRDNNVPMMITLMQSSRALGMQTMDDYLEQLVRDRVIRFDDALRRAADRARFERHRPASTPDSF